MMFGDVVHGRRSGDQLRPPFESMDTTSDPGSAERCVGTHASILRTSLEAG